MALGMDNWEEMWESQSHIAVVLYLCFSLLVCIFFTNIFLAIVMGYYSEQVMQLEQDISSGKQRDITELILDAAASCIRRKLFILWGKFNKKAADDAMMLEFAKKERDEALRLAHDVNLDIPEEEVSVFIQKVGPEAMAWFDRLAELEGNLSSSDAEKFGLFLKDNRASMVKPSLGGVMLGLLKEDLLVKALLKRQIEMHFAKETYVTTGIDGKIGQLQRGAKTRTVISADATPQEIAEYGAALDRMSDDNWMMIRWRVLLALARSKNVRTGLVEREAESLQIQDLLQVLLRQQHQTYTDIVKQRPDLEWDKLPHPNDVLKDVQQQMESTRNRRRVEAKALAIQRMPLSP